MASINPYLNFQGKSEEAFNFYKGVFGGEFAGLIRFGDTEHGAQMSTDDQQKIMHIALPIGNNILMATDMLESMGQMVTRGNSSTISVDAESDEDGLRIYNSLAEGGEAFAPYAPAPWGGKWGMLTDKFGVQWMVSWSEGHPQE